jgi:hypothetical protein
VALLGNLDLDQRDGWREDVAYRIKLGRLLLKLGADLRALPKGSDGQVSDDDARKVFSNAVGDLLAASKCPDFVVNRGHYFGTDYFAEEPGLSDEDKFSLIAFLKTF